MADAKIAAAQIARHKHFLRGFYKQTVLALPAARRARDARAAAARLATLPLFRDAETVAVYVSMPGEMGTKPVFDLCRRLRKTVAVPVVFPESFSLGFSLIGPGTRWGKNVYGIPEPRNPRLLDPRNVELLVVPGRAFTSDGGRLGTGGGYYDRFLETHQVPTIGLAHDAQIAVKFPRAPHDAPMNAVVTPTRTYRPR